MSRDPRPQLSTGIILFLAGPVIWIIHFWLVYLVAEAVCTSEASSSDLQGIPAVSVVVLALTLVLMGVSGWLASIAYRRRPAPNGDGHLLMWGGAALGALFTLAVILVGLPALVLTPC